MNDKNYSSTSPKTKGQEVDEVIGMNSVSILWCVFVDVVISIGYLNREVKLKTEWSERCLWLSGINACLSVSHSTFVNNFCSVVWVGPDRHTISWWSGGYLVSNIRQKSPHGPHETIEKVKKKFFNKKKKNNI